MRVGIVTYGLDRALMGIGNATKRLIEALAETEPTLELVPITPYKQGPFRQGAWRSYYLPGCRLLPGLMTWGNLGLLAASRRARLDIVHDPTSVGPFLIPWGWGHRKKILTIYDAIPYVHPESHTALNNLLYRRWLPLVMGNVDAVVVPSESTKADVIRYLRVPPTKISVIRCGVDGQFRPVEDLDQARAVLHRYGIEQPYLLYVGGIEPRKNITGLLQAFSMIKERLPGHKLVIVGKKNWKYERTFGLVEELGLQADVVFTGYVPDEHLPQFYGMAEVLVFPSLYEGFGLPPLEAMACGTPVVCSNTSSLPEVVGDAAICVDPHDVRAIADAIESVLGSQTLRDELAQKGLARARSFSWERAAKETAALYKDLLSA